MDSIGKIGTVEKSVILNISKKERLIKKIDIHYEYQSGVYISVTTRFISI